MSDQLLRQMTKEELAQRMRQEYGKFRLLLNQRPEEINNERSDLPKIVVTGSSIQLGLFRLYVQFDQLFTDVTDARIAHFSLYTF